MCQIVSRMLLVIQLVSCGLPERAAGSDRTNASSNADVRVWKNSGGEELFHAALFAVQGEHLYLRKYDESECRVPIGSFGLSDRDYARKWAFDNNPHRLMAPADIGLVSHVAFSPLGNQVLTRSFSTPDEPILRLYDAATSRLISTYDTTGSFSDQVVDIGFSHAGRFVFASFKSGKLIVWKAVSGDLYRKFNESTSPVLSAFFLADSRHIAVQMEDASSVYDIRTGAVHYDTDSASPLPAPPFAFAVKEGAILSTDRDGDVELFRSQDQSVQHFRGHEKRARAVGLLPDGQRIVSVDGTGMLRVWSRETGEIIKKFQVTDPKTAAVYDELPMAVSSDGSQVAVGLIGMQVWNLDREKVVSATQWQQAAHIDNFQVLRGGELAVVDLDDRTEIYDTRTGALIGTRLPASYKKGPVSFTHRSYSRDGEKVLLTLNTGAMAVLELDPRSTRWRNRVPGLKWASLNPAGTEVLALDGEAACRRFDVATGEALPSALTVDRSLGKFNATISHDGRQILFASSEGLVRLHDIETGELLRAIGSQPRRGFGAHFSATISSDGRHIATLGDELQIWNVADGQLNRSINLRDATQERCVAFAPVEKTNRMQPSTRPPHVMTCGSDSAFRIWNVETAERIVESTQGTVAIRQAEFIGDGQNVLAVSEIGVGHIWSASTGEELLRIGHSGSPRGLTISAPDGRFLANLEQKNMLHWILPDEPFRPLSLDLLARDYYEPGLLPTVLARKERNTRSVRNVVELNRIQPVVEISSVAPNAERPNLVDLDVTVENQTRDVFGNTINSGLRDVHLFRDGRLVGFHSLANVDETVVVKFRDIQLPETGVDSAEFTAYAFNSDGVKSETTQPTVQNVKLSPRRGRAYVVAVGVDAFEPHAGSTFGNLQFAARDAVAYSSQLGEALSASEQFSEVVTIPLTSTGNSKTSTATKEAIKTVFDALSGDRVNAALLANVPQAERLQRARPTDAVFIAFSSHGFTRSGALAEAKLGGKVGEFYLVPSDIGDDQGGGVLGRCISAEQLATWLRGIDAGEMTMIIDACQSAGSAGQDFKPGPMGSRGLGQLAYNKKMRILAASQVTQPATENRLLGHGLLSYTLLSGLETFAADESADGQITVSEWLRYAEAHVPDVAQKVASGSVQLVTFKDAKLLGGRKQTKHQQPVLFDFNREDVGIVIRKTSSKRNGG